MHPYVQYSITDNSQNMEVSINRRINPFSYKKEYNLAICENTECATLSEKSEKKTNTI